MSVQDTAAPDAPGWPSAYDPDGFDVPSYGPDPDAPPGDAVPTDPVPTDPLPTDPEAGDDADSAGSSGGGRSGRVVVLAVLGGLLALALLIVFLLPESASVRQQHLRDEYREPATEVAVGEAALLLQIPILGMDQVVTRGAEPVQLRGGPGWREGSAPPGQGNTVILGHSTLWSYPFGQIDQLVGGNRIFVRTRDDRVYVYKVTEVTKVDGSETEVMVADGPTRLTLVTSAGGPFSSERVVVTASASGPQPEVPEDARVPVSDSEDVGSFDERPASGAVLLLAGAMVAVAGAFAARDLRRRYSLGVAVVIGGPVVAIGVVLVLFNLNSFLPVTY
ncbi:MAG: sortase [Actinobacteria bacterium]|nr:sortase [Actinomycetota bacterium]